MPDPRAILPALLALSLGACQRDEVAHYRIPKEQPEAAAPGGPAGGAPSAPPGMAGDVPAPPRPSGEGALAWTLPRTWTETRGGSAMRFATLRPPVEGRIDVSVTVLPGEAGGELANVNRWRGQIGLPPIDEAALTSSRKAVKTSAGTVNVYDFTSEGTVKSRTIAGLTEKEGSTWFVKMSGDAGPVAKAQPDFLRLLESLHFETR